MAAVGLIHQYTLELGAVKEGLELAQCLNCMIQKNGQLQYDNSCDSY